MRLTAEEAAVLIARFTQRVSDWLGEDVTIKDNTDGYHVELLRKRKRVPHPIPPRPEMDGC